MMTGHVVPLDAVGVEVVEDGQAHLIAVAVVRLRLNGFSSTEKKWLNFITVIRDFCVNQQQTFQTIKFFSSLSQNDYPPVVDQNRVPWAPIPSVPPDGQVTTSPP